MKSPLSMGAVVNPQIDEWDECHPANACEELGFEEYETPEIPTIDSLPGVVDYSTRGPGDWVNSGPLPGSTGPGRRFDSELSAFRWCSLKYGQKRVSRIDAGEMRWACLIRKI